MESLFIRTDRAEERVSNSSSKTVFGLCKWYDKPMSTRRDFLQTSRLFTRPYVALKGIKQSQTELEASWYPEGQIFHLVTQLAKPELRTFNLHPLFIFMCKTSDQAHVFLRDQSLSRTAVKEQLLLMAKFRRKRDEMHFSLIWRQFRQLVLACGYAWLWHQKPSSENNFQHWAGQVMCENGSAR